MRIGYNTNGLAFHRWPDVLELLAETGYQSVAITVDHNCLDPFAPDLPAKLDATRERLERLQFDSVIETGARYLLNPRVKHDPTLVSPTPAERAVRIDFLKRCVDVADRLGSSAVSFWSGRLPDNVPDDVAFQRLADGCREVLDYAANKNVALAFEPEPGMLVERLSQFERLAKLADAPHFGLALDIGHVHCVEDGDIASHLRRWAGHIRTVHIEDMRKGIHEHLRFGEGEIDFRPVIQTLAHVGYQESLNVELSRHSHMAPEVLRESYEFLAALLHGSPE